MSIGIAVMGVLVGFLVGLTGVGGATLLTPVLIMMGINPLIAVGTDLVYNSITKLFGVIQHWKQKTINFKLMKYLAIGSLPSAAVAIALLQIFESSFYNKDQIIKHSLGYVLILAAIAILTQSFFDNKFKPNRWQLKSIEEKRGVTILIGVVFGFIVGLTSIGSGSLFALAMLYFYRLSASELVGTDVAHGFLLVTVAGLLHAKAGSVDYTLVGNLLIGSIPGVLLGSTLSTKIPVKPMRLVITMIIIISGIKLIT